MADVVTLQLVENGPRDVVVRFADVSDGTGLANFVLLDATSSGPLGVVVQGQTLYPGTHLKIRQISYSLNNMTAQLYWQASAPYLIAALGFSDHLFFDNFGGLPNPGTPGATGSLLLNLDPNDPTMPASATLIIRCTKGIHQ